MKCLDPNTVIPRDCGYHASIIYTVMSKSIRQNGLISFRAKHTGGVNGVDLMKNPLCFLLFFTGWADGNLVFMGGGVHIVSIMGARIGNISQSPHIFMSNDMI